MTKMPTATVTWRALLIHDGNYPRAEELLKKSLMVEPLNPASLTLLCEAEIETGDLDGVLQTARKVHQLPHEGYSVVHDIAGEAYEREGQPQNAAIEYETYLRESPNGPEAAQVRSSLARLTAANPVLRILSKRRLQPSHLRYPRRTHMMTKLGLALLLLFIANISTASDNAAVLGGNGVVLPPPPPTKVEPVTETIHGVTVTDPYRWLEDSKSPATRAWLTEQMKYTEDYLSQVKIRPEVVKRLTELVRVDSYSIPVERGQKYFFKKRMPEENQGSIYVRDGLKGNDERLVDATKLSTDQNTSVNVADVSKDGSLLVYDVREGGADEQSIHLLDVKSRTELPDVLPKARYAGVNLTPDEKGLYYAKFAPTGSEVFYHTLGTPVSADPMVFGKSFGGESFGQMELIYPEVTENGNYLDHSRSARRSRQASRYLREGPAHARRADQTAHSRHR